MLGTLEARRKASEASTELGLRVLELANRAHSLWLRQDHAEREKLLRVLTLDGVSLSPEWRKPFDVTAEGLVQPIRSGGKDLNLRPHAPKARALPDCATARLLDSTLLLARR